MANSVRRVAIVTGSARNIGRATALALSRMGAAVMLHAREDAEGVAETGRLIERAGGEAASHLADLTNETAAEALVAAAVERFGRLDILVNNAAIRRNKPFTELTLAEWREVVAVSLEGAFLCCRAAIPHMVTQRYGRIVNLGGVAAHRGIAQRAHVAASKAGMVGLTKAIATEFAAHGIVANMVVPGMIETERGAAAGARPPQLHTTANLLGREGRPEEVAHMIAMLCAEEAAFTTGQAVHVNGGAYMP